MLSRLERAAHLVLRLNDLVALPSELVRVGASSGELETLLREQTLNGYQLTCAGAGEYLRKDLLLLLTLLLLGRLDLYGDGLAADLRDYSLHPRRLLLRLLGLLLRCLLLARRRGDHALLHLRLLSLSALLTLGLRASGRLFYEDRLAL